MSSRAIDFLELHDMRIARLVVEPARVEIFVRTASVFYVDHLWGPDDNSFASCLLVCGGVRDVHVGEWPDDTDYVYDGRVALADGTVIENMIEPSRFAGGPAAIESLWLGLASRNTAIEITCATLELRDLVIEPRTARARGSRAAPTRPPSD